MFKKKLFILPVLVLVIGASMLLLAGCQKKAPSPDKQTQHRSISPELKTRKITVLTYQPHLKASEHLAKWFSEETGIIVRNILTDREGVYDYIVKSISSSDPQLDVLTFWYVDIGRMVKNEILVDITDTINHNKEIIQPEDFISAFYDHYTLYEGRRWALPYDGDINVLLYRKSILENYNLSPPETWDDYLNIARTITENEKDNGIYGTAIMAPPRPMVITSAFMNRLGGYGGRLLDDNGKPKINSKEAVKALSAMVEHAKYSLPTPLETNFETSRDAFLSGRVAMVEQWPTIGLMAEDPHQSLIQGDWGAVRIPKGEGPEATHVTALNGGFSMGISSHSKNIQAAEAYVLFAARPDIALRLNSLNGGIDPTRISVLNSPTYQQIAPEMNNAVQESMKNPIAWPTDFRVSELLDVLTENLIKTLEGQISPQQALDDTQKQWGKILL